MLYSCADVRERLAVAGIKMTINRVFGNRVFGISVATSNRSPHVVCLSLSAPGSPLMPIGGDRRRLPQHRVRPCRRWPEAQVIAVERLGATEQRVGGLGLIHALG